MNRTSDFCDYHDPSLVDLEVPEQVANSIRIWAGWKGMAVSDLIHDVVAEYSANHADDPKVPL